ncbi:Hypothetical predicted protein [Podarcis lilfordi]|uniref:Uncharacterized protein n=1 Tax=Podarcis lilfordi TaxID=74358 RepID=A0AA35L2G4_9SAUR|nr:Hypothetical predicted protein [Podarcis lilfordi]
MALLQSHLYRYYPPTLRYFQRYAHLYSAPTSQSHSVHALVPIEQRNCPRYSQNDSVVQAPESPVNDGTTFNPGRDAEQIHNRLSCLTTPAKFIALIQASIHYYSSIVRQIHSFKIQLLYLLEVICCKRWLQGSEAMNHEAYMCWLRTSRNSDLQNHPTGCQS